MKILVGIIFIIVGALNYLLFAPKWATMMGVVYMIIGVVTLVLGVLELFTRK